MISTARIKLLIIAGVASFACACDKTSSQSSALPFEFTNILHEASTFRKIPTTETIIYFTNGSWFGHQPGLMTLGLGVSDYEISVFFNPSNRAVRKIIQQYSIGTNRYWLIDRNGDGLPDQRQILGDETEDVLFRGEWSRARGRSNREVFVNGEWTPIHFIQGTWREKKSDEANVAK